MIRVGIAGLGFMGMIHYLAYQRVPGVRVAAICSRDRKKLAGDWRTIEGNFGPPGTIMDVEGVDRYESYDGMLANSKLDMIDVCLPPAMHCGASVAAFNVGKHVFCEKPISLSTREAQTMLKASVDTGRLFHIGHVLPFFPEYLWALHAARTNRYGKLIGGRFQRSIADPKWLPNYFDLKSTGGPLLDLLVHDAHFIRLLYGMPRTLFSRGHMHHRKTEVPEFVETQFVFDDSSQVVTAGGGVIRQSGRAFSQSFEIRFERATLAYDFAVIDGLPRQIVPLTVYEAKGKVTVPKLASGDPMDAFVREIQEVVLQVKRNKTSSILGAGSAADAQILCRRQSQSIKSGKLVRV